MFLSGSCLRLKGELIFKSILAVQALGLSPPPFSGLKRIKRPELPGLQTRWHATSQTKQLRYQGLALRFAVWMASCCVIGILKQLSGDPQREAQRL